jgi:hypothetical protein
MLLNTISPPYKARPKKTHTHTHTLWASLMKVNFDAEIQFG